MLAPAQILLVEDNPGDVRLVMEALNEAPIATHMHVVEDGVEALAYLRREGKFASAPRPQLILLDLNLPRKDGRDVLADVKRDHDLRRIPVIVLTSSDAEQDIAMSYDLHANCFISKPVNLEKFLFAVRTVAEFWLQHVKLPAE